MENKEKMLKYTKKTLLEHGIKPLKKLSQHFMVEPLTIKQMVAAADLGPDDHAVEVGAGTGNLSLEIIKRSGKSTLIEKDRRLFRILKERFMEFSNVEFLNIDALDYSFPHECKILSNMPYHLSSKLIFHILKYEFKVSVLTLQKEFGDRLVAKPGTKNYGRLSIHAQLKADIDVIRFVPKTFFWPPPKVDSVMVKLVPRRVPLNDFEQEVFNLIVNSVFKHRNKKICNAVKIHSETFRKAGISPEKALKVLEEEFLSQKRSFEISINKYMEVSKQIAEETRNDGLSK